MDKYQKYRLKDVKGYRARKSAWARTPEQRMIRTEYMRKWRAENRERHNRQARESQQRNKHKHIERNRNYALLKKFGITTQQKLAMIESQLRKCRICTNDLVDSHRTHVDHCHKTNRIRGILCASCNTRLGWYEAFRFSINEYLA